MNKARRARRHVERPYVPIPLDKLPEMINLGVHVTWARQHGMSWILKEIQGSRVRLMAWKTGKDFWTDASSVCYTRKNEPQVQTTE